jgi:hypothetical protein
MTGDKLAVIAPPPRPLKDPSKVGRTLRWVVLLVLGIGLMLLLYLLASSLPIDHGTVPPFVNHPTSAQHPSTTQTTDNSPSPPAGRLQPIQVASAKSFDPLPLGSGDENPSQAALAIDGNPETFWSTLVYFNGATFGGTKPGVGLVLDLGSAQEVRGARVTLIGTPTSLQLRAAPEDATRAPLLAPGYTTVSTLTDAGTQGVFTLEEPVTTRYLLVWITSMPKVPTGYQGKVAEIQVFG